MGAGPPATSAVPDVTAVTGPDLSGVTVVTADSPAPHKY